MFAGFILQLFYTYMFSGGVGLWATNEPSRDRSGECKTTIQTRDENVALLSIWHWLCCGVRLPIRHSRSFPIARSFCFSASNPTIDCLPDRAVRLFSGNSMSLARLLFWTKSLFLCSLGITHHALVHRKLSVPWPRPACSDSDALHQRFSWQMYLKPRPGVNHVKSRRCSSHSPTKTGN